MRLNFAKTPIAVIVAAIVLACGSDGCRHNDHFTKIDFHRLARTPDADAAIQDTRQLDGTAISIVGQTYLNPRAPGLIDEFTLGPIDPAWFPPPAYYGVRVLLPQKADAGNLPRYVRIKGIFHIDPQKRVVGHAAVIYRIEAAEIDAISVSPSGEIPVPASALGVAILTVLGGWLCVRSRRRKLRLARLARRSCVNCGYDLRGNTTGVCPECGEPVEEIKTPQHEEPALGNQGHRVRSRSGK